MTMPSYEITINPLIAMGIVLFFGGIGFLLKRRQLEKDKKLFNKYEKEMVLNHADILDLQKDYITLELKMRELSIPVIPFNTPVKEATPASQNVQETEALPIDAALRKKLLLNKEVGKDKTRSSISPV